MAVVTAIDIVVDEGDVVIVVTVVDTMSDSTAETATAHVG